MSITTHQPTHHPSSPCTTSPLSATYRAAQVLSPLAHNPLLRSDYVLRRTYVLRTQRRATHLTAPKVRKPPRARERPGSAGCWACSLDCCRDGGGGRGGHGPKDRWHFSDVDGHCPWSSIAIKRRIQNPCPPIPLSWIRKSKGDDNDISMNTNTNRTATTNNQQPTVKAAGLPPYSTPPMHLCAPHHHHHFPLPSALLPSSILLPPRACPLSHSPLPLPPLSPSSPHTNIRSVIAPKRRLAFPLYPSSCCQCQSRSAPVVRHDGAFQRRGTRRLGRTTSGLLASWTRTSQTKTLPSIP